MLPALLLLRQSGRADPLPPRLLQQSPLRLQKWRRSLISRRPVRLQTGLSLSSLVGKVQCNQRHCRRPDPAAAVTLSMGQ